MHGLAGDRDAGRIHVDEEHGQAAARALLRIGGGHELQEVRALGVRDEPLVAVDHVTVALPHRGGAHSARIGARIGLGLRKCRGFFTAQDRMQIAILLLRVERKQDGAHLRSKNSGAARRQRNRPGELFVDDGESQQTQILAAQVCRHFEQPQSKLSGLCFQPLADIRLEVRAVHRLHLDWDQLPLDKFSNGVLKKSDIVREFEIHSVEPVTWFRA